MFCIKCHKEIEDDSVFCRFCGKKQVSETRKILKRANGTGSVYKLSGRRRAPYVATVSKTIDNEQTKTILGYYATKTEALNALDAARITPIPDGYNLTLQDVYDIWSEQHYTKLSTSAENTYKAAWQYLKPFADVKMRNINSRHIQAAIDKAVKAGKGRSTCHKIKVVAGMLCKQAMKDDIINKDYSQFVILPEESSKEKSIFTKSEIQQLWQHQSNRTAQIILTLIYTGVRINELFAMTPQDVHLDNRYMVGGSKTDAGRRRIIPIHKDVLPFIAAWIDENRDKTYLLCNQNGNKIDAKNFRSRSFYPFLEDVGILEKDVKPPRLTPHSTRHTFISEMVKANAKPEYLQRIVGHEQYETTIDFYTHITEDDIGALINEVDNHLHLR